MSKTIDRILGSVSPLYGIVSGRGLFGRLADGAVPLLGAPAAGLASARSARRKRGMGDGTDPSAAAPTMKKGGKIRKKPTKGYAAGGSVSKRADGIARKGKTRGKVR